MNRCLWFDCGRARVVCLFSVDLAPVLPAPSVLASNLYLFHELAYGGVDKLFVPQ